MLHFFFVENFPKPIFPVSPGCGFFYIIPKNKPPLLVKRGFSDPGKT